MCNKNKIVFDKKLPYEYNICLYILEKLCDEGVIDIFEMPDAKIPAAKKLGKELIKEASPEHKLRIYTYVRVSIDSELLTLKLRF